MFVLFQSLQIPQLGSIFPWKPEVTGHGKVPRQAQPPWRPCHTTGPLAINILHFTFPLLGPRPGAIHILEVPGWWKNPALCTKRPAPRHPPRRDSPSQCLAKIWPVAAATGQIPGQGLGAVGALLAAGGEL